VAAGQAVGLSIIAETPRDSEQDAREKANYERALELERQAAALARKERDLTQDKASF
jgi:hypothetical protein